MFHDIEEAREAALKYLNAGLEGLFKDGESPTMWAIAQDEVIEKDYGWIFRYVSPRYIETGKIEDLVLGSGNVVVERDGYIGVLRGIYSKVTWIKIHEARRCPTWYRRLVANLYILRDDIRLGQLWAFFLARIHLVGTNVPKRH